MEGDRYKGIPLEELRIDSIDWTFAAEHIRTRSVRKHPGELDVEPTWATEAGLDPRRIVRTTEGDSVKVIGWSASAPPRGEQDQGRILKIWIVPKDLDAGDWWGSSACDANERDRKRYGEVEDDDG